MIEEVMEPCDSQWRGAGDHSRIRSAAAGCIQSIRRAAEIRGAAHEWKAKSGLPLRDVLQGKCRPSDCKVFGTACTPQHPIGACMVSNEGSCSAYYQYGMDQ